MFSHKILSAFIAAVLLFICPGCRKKTDVPGTINTKDSLFIFVMAGQSNMAGRGIMEAQDTIINPNIYVIDSAGKLAIAREPLHFYQTGFSGLDCGLSFGNTLLPFLPKGTKICLVPCAISSTSIQDWLGDSSHGVKLYTNMLSRTHTALQSGVLKGILWHQGESNAESIARAQNYATDLQAFIRKIRQDTQLPDLPFYAGTLAPFCARPLKDSINSSLYRTASVMQEVFVVATDGLTQRGDSVHFDAAGQRGLGQRFAEIAKFHWQ